MSVMEMIEYPGADLHQVRTRLDRLEKVIKEGHREILNTFKDAEKKAIIKFIEKEHMYWPL